MAQKAKHTFPVIICSIIDQFASVLGQKDKVFLLDYTGLEYRYIPLRFKDYLLLLINTKVHHTLADGEYNKQKMKAKVALKYCSHICPI